MAKPARHPLAKQTYTLLEDGQVEVFDERQQTTGIFDRRGTWVSGDLKSADIHMIEWVTGRT